MFRCMPNWASFSRHSIQDKATCSSFLLFLALFAPYMDNVDTALLLPRNFQQSKQKSKKKKKEIFNAKKARDSASTNNNHVCAHSTRCTARTRIYTVDVKVNLIRKLEENTHTHTQSKTLYDFQNADLENV